MKFLFLFLCLFSPSNELPPGSIIFVENGNFFVEQITNSTITHVAIVVNENGENYVYEAVKPKVRKLTLKEYLKTTKEKLYVSIPKQKFDNEKLQSYLSTQLGKKYSIENYNKKKPNEKTIFCSQLVVDCYNHCGFEVFSYYSQYYAPVNVWEVVSKNTSLVFVLKESEK